MNRVMIAACLAGSVLVSALASCSMVSAQPPVSRTAVLEMLSGYEYIPSRRDLDALGPGVPPVLMDIASDAQMMTYHRLRALELLGQYPDHPEVPRFLTNVLADTQMPGGFVRIAMSSLARTARGKAVDTLKPFLSATDVHTREAAARALFETGDSSTGELLKGAAMKEPEPFLRSKMMNMSRQLETGLRDPDRERQAGSERRKEQGKKVK